MEAIDSGKKGSRHHHAGQRTVPVTVTTTCTDLGLRSSASSAITDALTIFWEHKYAGNGTSCEPVASLLVVKIDVVHPTWALQLQQLRVTTGNVISPLSTDLSRF